MKAILISIALLTLFADNQAQAGTPQTVVYCIDDSTEYTSMLTALNALPSHDKNYELRFRPGTFASNTTYPVLANYSAQIAWRPRWVTTYANYTFKLSGEWNAGCSAQNAPGGTTSTLNGLDLYTIFFVSEVDYTETNYTPLIIDINRIDFWRYSGYGAATGARGGGHDTRVSYSRFRSGIGTALSSSNDSIVVHNSLFEGNNPGGNFFSIVDIDSEGTTLMSNNTFRNNTLSGSSSKTLLELGNVLNTTPSGLAIFENNVIYQNTFTGTSDAINTDTYARIKNNILDPALVAGTPLFLSNNYNVDPKFAFVSGSQVLADSPARDLGNNASTNGATLDLYGRARVQNLVVDIGAYELSPPVIVDDLFKNSFE